MTCDTGRVKPPFHETIARLTAVSLNFIAALAITRALYEGTFPHLPFLADPFPILLFSGVVAITSNFTWRWLAEKADSAWGATAVFTPLLLNIIYLSEAFASQTAVSPQRGNFLLFTSLWLAALLAVRLVRPRGGRWQDWLFILVYVAPIYLLTLGRTVGKADSFEFQVVIPQLEIAHPTGYPLYILLTKLFTLIPIGGMAWRVNLITAVYALAAILLLYEFVSRLTGRRIVGVLTAVLFALTPTFWSQAVAAEVYSLNSLIVITALVLMQQIGKQGIQATRENGQLSGKNDISPEKNDILTGFIDKLTINGRLLPIILAFVLGLGLTNHLTSLILLPPAVLTLFFARKQYSFRPLDLLKMLAAFLVPLLLYAYLPIRWQALHGEPMGAARFVDWVVAGRFRGALQLQAWLHDPTRYAVVGRLFLAEWTAFYLLIGAVGFGFLARIRWKTAVILALIFAGYSFYALNYYVPDLAVFLIPAQLVIAISVGLFLALLHHKQLPAPISTLLMTAAILPFFVRAGLTTWPQVDQSHDDGLTRWGEAILALPLAENSAILADSEKIAPLYYLQRAEGIRPDLDIVVLPDEAAYRAELDARLAANQDVYLARYLPNLQAIYYLRAMGPLTAVSTHPLTDLPADATAISQTYRDIDLVGYAIEADAAIAAGQTAVSLYWQAPAPTDEPLHVYLRWQDDRLQNGNPINPAGVHPANNNYPTNAWRANEIVSDFHLLPRPISPIAQEINLQVAVAPAFTAAADLAWQTVTTVAIPPTTDVPVAQQHRILLGETAVSGTIAPTQLRPDEPLSVLLRGYGNPNIPIAFAGDESEATQLDWQAGNPFVTLVEMGTDGVENGRYPITIAANAASATCGWMRVKMDSCTIGEVEISGVHLPANAINYDDKIALLAIDLPDELPSAGGQLPLTLHWQALSPLDEDYTVFIQLLDENDALVGQIDAWPLQGTYPTSQWQVGETVNDPYLMQLNGELGDGEYRLLVGYYLLADLRRLPVLDANGAAVDDKLTILIDN